MKKGILIAAVLMLSVALIAGCGSTVKKNVLGVGASTGAATSTPDQQASSKAAEKSTVEGLSAIQAIFKSQSVSNSKSNAIALCAAAKRAGRRTVSSTWNMVKDDEGYYKYHMIDHRDSTYDFKFKFSGIDMWAGSYGAYETWNNKNEGDVVTNVMDTIVDYTSPLDFITSTSEERVTMGARIKAYTSSYGYYDEYGTWHSSYQEKRPDWNDTTMTVRGNGRSDNSSDNSWMTYSHRSTGTNKGAETHNDTWTEGTWTWESTSGDTMNFALSSGYSGKFTTKFTSIYKYEWKWTYTYNDQGYMNGGTESGTSTENLNIAVSGSIYKETTEKVRITFTARNVVDGMKIEGYYTLADDNFTKQYEFDPAQFAFLSSGMMNKREGGGRSSMQ